MNYIDLHCDTASVIFENKKSLRSNTYHVDLEKLHQGDYSAQWFAFFIHVSKLKDQSPLDYFRQMYDYFLEQVEAANDLVTIVTDYEGYKACVNQKKIAAFLSLEEGAIIGEDFDVIEELLAKGIRLMTLTWNKRNQLAHPHHEKGGLTPWGREVVAYLNDTPMLLDVSHLSDEGLKTCISLYKKPLIASHSNARGYLNHTRNLDDASIRAIARSGGVIGTNFYSYFLSNREKTTCNDLVEAIMYMYKIGGEDVLALGTDFDGIDCEIEVCNCSKMAILVDGLSKVLPSRIIDKLCYQNVLRLIKENL